MNRFLASLPVAARDALQPHLENVVLNAGDVLHRMGGPVDYVYFPHSGLVSITVTMQSGKTANTGIVGQDGLICSAIVLDVSIALVRVDSIRNLMRAYPNLFLDTGAFTSLLRLVIDSPSLPATSAVQFSFPDPQR